MEELLLPSGEEEARSDHSSCAPGHGGATMGDRVKTLLRGAVKEDLRRKVRNFCKRNGLLTLSVIAVLTGCTLGFMLRGTELSTQVRVTGGPGRRGNLSEPAGPSRFRQVPTSCQNSASLSCYFGFSAGTESV